ncbi:MAG: acetyl-CoA carboxylase biotin carboxyl carrier protein [Bacteroidia bacterium]|nr:acetyl-CoA carboxylase biotin carboxyl carrier protein [Bacteroidia bacterium]
MDFKSIQEILRFVSKSDLTEVEIEEGDFKLRIKRKGGEPPIVYHTETVHPEVQHPVVVNPVAPVVIPQQVVPAQPVTPTISTANETSSSAELYTIKAPMIGTFYRSPGPDKEPFVKVGDIVSKGDVLCIIEAMKLFNEIESEVSGKIVKILIENAKPVEYDQPLFVVELSK